MGGWPYWKFVQKEFAEVLGGEDLGIKGKVDVRTEEGCYEIKCLKHHPKQLKKWLEQAEKHTEEGKKSYLIIHFKESHKLNDLLIRRVKDHLADLTILRTHSARRPMEWLEYMLNVYNSRVEATQRLPVGYIMDKIKEAHTGENLE